MKQLGMLALILGALAPGGAAQAAEELRSGAALAFPSVQEGGSARAIGMGSTYVGVAEGSAALLWNPAGLANLQRPEIALHHNSALVGAFQEIAVIGLPIAGGNGLGISLNYEDNGSFEGRDSLGARTGSYSAGAYGASFGWGIAGPAGLALGLAVKANHRDLAGNGSDAFAGDIGALWSPSPRLSLGAAYTNLGPEVGGNPLAQGLRVGLSSYLNKGHDHEWLAAFSAEALSFGDSSLHAGLEHTLFKVLSLRGGYGLNLSHPQPMGLLGWNAGAGVKIQDLAVDYSFTPLADLGNMQRVSLTYAFGEARKPAKPARAKAKPKAKAAPKPTPTPSATPSPAPSPEAQKTPGNSYIVKPGDSLWKISGEEKVLGDSFRWPLLYKSNRNQLSDPDIIEPDQDLTFKDHYSKRDTEEAIAKAKETPRYVPHQQGAKTLPLKY